MENSTVSDDKESTTLFHVTHGKAGSQWIHRILIGCAQEKIIPPHWDLAKFLETKMQAGKIYPTVYVTQQQFNSMHLPPKWKRFVVIRDLRDSLVSAYFSLKISHPPHESFLDIRKYLNEVRLEEGLICLMKNGVDRMADIQNSWLDGKEPIIRYEDLLERDVELLSPILSESLPTSEEKIKEIIIANRFENFTKGRLRGDEDVTSHERKGMPGDWKNYFSANIKDEFKKIFGDLIIKSGYEQSYNW